MKVSDIMTRDVMSVKKDTPLSQAAGILAKFRIHGMPVVNDENKVIGIITESDFFTKDSSNIYLPTFLEFIKKDKDSEEMYKSKTQEAMERMTTVKDIMTEECVTVRPELSLEKLIFLLKEKNFNSFPVVNDDNELLGIITVMDIIKLL